MQTMQLVVRAALARRLRRDMAAIHEGDRLSRDLGLMPLDVVVVALDVEKAARVPIPLDALASVETVADLAAYLAAHVTRGRAASGVERANDLGVGVGV